MARARLGWSVLVVVGLVALCAVFVLVDQSFTRLVDGAFPAVGTSAWLATAFGLASRPHLVVLLVVLALRRPGLLGLRLGESLTRWRLVTGLGVLSCAVVGGYLVLTGSGTPYSGDQWLLTEVVTVPVVEELLWRGVVLSLLTAAFARVWPQRRAATLAVWCGGLAFGLLHGANALVGVPLAFVAVQVVNATVWGVVYGYARVLTGSVWPPVLLHAAMNLVVVLV